MRREAGRGELMAVHERFVKTVGVGYSRDYEWVVPAATREAAWAAVRDHAPLLGLDPETIGVKWFSAEEDAEHADFWSETPLLGRCRPKAEPRVIWLNSSLSADEAADIAAHELNHISGGDETEARLYETRARLQRMGYLP
jgi:hypothetical protein